MWDGKNKAVTFSFDDGVTQDIRLIEILDKYGLKATFNLNSSLFGLKGTLIRNGVEVWHDKILPTDVKKVYQNHEIAVHTLTHPNLAVLSDETVIYQVEEDRKKLSDLAGYNVVGMAYPGGGSCVTERVVNAVKTGTGVSYARNTESTYSFDLQTNLYDFKPSVYYIEVDKMFELAQKFIGLKTEVPQLFYIWGHSYEMDANYISWAKFEEFCKLISGKKDIFYGTNIKVLI